MNIQGKWTLITGASRGVGREIARAMASLGSNLILQSRSVEHVAPLLEELKEKGVLLKAVACDLESEKSIQTMLQEIDSFGVVVDFVFNNAGLQVPYCEDYFSNKREDYVQAYAVNCLAPVQIAYHFLP